MFTIFLEGLLKYMTRSYLIQLGPSVHHSVEFRERINQLQQVFAFIS